MDGAKKPQISLRLGAAAASRDITLFHAMDTLHLNAYNITKATSCLVPRGPVLCADELEAWTQGTTILPASIVNSNRIICALENRQVGRMVAIDFTTAFDLLECSLYFQKCSLSERQY